MLWLKVLLKYGIKHLFFFLSVPTDCNSASILPCFISCSSLSFEYISQNPAFNLSTEGSPPTVSLIERFSPFSFFGHL